MSDYTLNGTSIFNRPKAIPTLGCCCLGCCSSTNESLLWLSDGGRRYLLVLDICGDSQVNLCPIVLHLLELKTAVTQVGVRTTGE